MSGPKLYRELAGWWHLLSPPDGYAEEAAVYREHLMSAARGPVETVLELGSGGGNNASFLKAYFDMTLVEPSPPMIEVSRALNPECEHLEGDMRTVRLDREFDAVFVHDAICYMTSEEDLRAALATVSVHCSPGGSVVLAPDHLKDTFVESTEHGGSDEGERGLRYLEWTHDPDPDDTTYVADYAFLLRIGTEVEVVHDRHVNGLFPRSTWMGLLDDAGLDARPVEVRLSDASYEIFVAIKR